MKSSRRSCSEGNDNDIEAEGKRRRAVEQLGEALLLLAAVLAFFLVIAGVAWTGVRLRPEARNKATKEDDS
jgi:hypothetical protein